MFLTLDGTFWIQILNFFIFYWILNVVYIRPAARALQVRRAYIDSVQAEYEEALRREHELLQRADERSLEAHREAGRHAAKILAEAQSEVDRIGAMAQEQAARLIADAHQTVEAELKSARAREDVLVKELADVMVARAMAPGERRKR
ncbi:MAG: ATP synthase F0 subunit B [Candidatus Eremiobacteraeota bacterium]|nr:ATP synthase F0 subunit B [Candidatus Eremiobacteraeota bacterium]